MMKNVQKTLILLGFFFASLLIYWGLEYGGVRTDKERRLRDARILPELIDIAEANIDQIAIERGSERLVFRRRGAGIGRWQMIEPSNVAAEPTHLETLVRNLKELRKSADSGTVPGSADEFGLAPAVATVRLWSGKHEGGGQALQPIAALDVGKTVRGVRYVRAAGTDTIDVADSKLLSAIDLPRSDWREHVVMGIPTFQVASVTIKREGQMIRADRNERGHWRLSAPIKAPANPAKIESLLAALASLRVVGGADGFVADDVKDFAPFGLTDSALTVELTTTRPSEEPLILHLGKPVPEQPDRVYVRQGGQDDVVVVDAKALAEIPTSVVALRSQKVADIEPAAVNRIEIQTRGEAFSLSKGSTGWELTAPRREKADTISVTNLLKRIDELQTSEFLPADKAKLRELDPPAMTLRIWERKPSRSGAPAPSADPSMVLHFGKTDTLLKTVFARLGDDPTILAVPDTILEVLPRNAFAFRDLGILSFNPADVHNLTLTRAGRTDELEPAKTGEPNGWRLRQPVDARADTRAVTQILAMLSNLRADQFITDTVGDGKSFGLDHPVLEIAWKTDQPHWLKLGTPLPRVGAYYAQTDSQPFVFTLKTDVLKPLEAELHDRNIMTFPAMKAQRVAISWSWPPRTVTFKRRTPAAKGQSDWVDEPGSDAAGLDQSRIAALVKALSQLETVRFAQYDGELPPLTGLHRPRLTVEVYLNPSEPTRVLRIGYSTGEGHVFAAEGTSSSGPVFLLPAAAWDAFIQSGERFEPLPTQVFAPRL